MTLAETGRVAESDQVHYGRLEDGPVQASGEVLILVMKSVVDLRTSESAVSSATEGSGGTSCDSTGTVHPPESERLWYLPRGHHSAIQPQPQAVPH